MLSFKLMGASFAVVAALVALEAAAQNFRCHGINYNPRKAPDWAADKCKSSTDIQADMETLAQVADVVRLYSLSDCDQGMTVVPAAVNAGLKVSLGLWVSDDDAVFDAEKSKLGELIGASKSLFTDGSITDIHVGSEAVYRGDITAVKNIEYMDAIKELRDTQGLTSVPVTISEIGDTYLSNTTLIDAVDFVQANAFPFWEAIKVENAVPYLVTRLTPLFELAAAQNKKVVIGETGWAWEGSHKDASEASPANAAYYFQEFYNMAEQRGWEYFYFAGFDEEWKVEQNGGTSTVEGHFGLFRSDRTLKTEIAELKDDKETAVDESAGEDTGSSSSMYTTTGTGTATTGTTTSTSTGTDATESTETTGDSAYTSTDTDNDGCAVTPN